MDYVDYEMPRGHSRIAFIKAMRESGRMETPPSDLRVNVALETAIQNYADHYGITFERACTLIALHARD